MNYIQRIYDLLVEAVEINEVSVEKYTTTKPFTTEIGRSRQQGKDPKTLKGRVTRVQHSVTGIKGKVLGQDYIEGQRRGIEAATGKKFKRPSYKKRVANLVKGIEKRGQKKPETSVKISPFSDVVKKETYSSGTKKGKR